MFQAFDFNSRIEDADVLDFVSRNLSKYAIHSSHPGYFGFYNPPSAAMGVFADALTAIYNPQLATWNHASFAVAAERHLLRCFGEKFGYSNDSVDGTFTSGGSEANHTALLAALTNSFPEFDRAGLRAIAGRPVFFVSREGHYTFQKAARACGLGTDAVIEIPLGDDYKMDGKELSKAIAAARRRGDKPFLVVGAVGTTTGGIIDPLPELAEIAAKEGLWFHVDAAWGGAAALVPELRGHLSGIERADSITFDAHKWLAMPMGAGMFITRHPEILDRTFHVSITFMPSYMPPKRSSDEPDPYAHSMQWSRRFIGLKIFLALATIGWEGYADVIRHHVAMGELLKRLLAEHRWRIINSTPLPVVCFQDESRPDGDDPRHLLEIARRTVTGGKFWISASLIGNRSVLRACVCNYRTTEDDIRALVDSLETIREE